MKTISILILMIVGLTFLSGCATSQLHFGGPEARKRTSKMGDAPRYVYAGTQANAQDLSILIPGNTSGDALYDGLTCLLFFVPLIDLPLCMVADTLFLPYDVYMVTAGGQTRYDNEDGPANKEHDHGANAPRSAK